MKINIFDLYNTLVRNTTRLTPYRYIYKIIEEQNKFTNSRDFFEYSMKKNMYLQEILEEKKIVIEEKYIKEFKKLMEMEMSSIIFNEELISMNKDKNNILLSNLSKEYYEPIIKLKSKMSFVQEILSYEVGMLKPDKNIFKLALNDKDSFKMYGDNYKLDIEPAIELGLETEQILKWW